MAFDKDKYRPRQILEPTLKTEFVTDLDANKQKDLILFINIMIRYLFRERADTTALLMTAL